MEPEAKRRRVWEIDTRLESLMGCGVRIHAEFILPKGYLGKRDRTIDGGCLILPDGTRADWDPIYVEGTLLAFQRDISMVHVELGEPAIEGTADGRITFRGRTAVILRGPVTAQLAHPFLVEMIPNNSRDYWDQLRWIDRQFELKF